MQQGASNRRKIHRRPARIPARFQTAEQSGQGQVANISDFGLFILAKELPRARDPIRITLVPKGEDELELRGTVRWTTEQLAHGTQNARGFGVELDSPCPDAVARLASWLGR